MPATEYNVLIYALDVGQGSGQFIVVKKGAVIEKTMIIDLGSERKTMRRAGGPAVEFVVRQLKTMERPRIDALIFSHSDADHIDLVTGVLSQFSATELSIVFTRYGGDRAKYTYMTKADGKKRAKEKNLIKLVEAYMLPGQLAATFHGNESDFNVTPVEPFLVFSGTGGEDYLKLYLVNGNATSVLPGGKKLRTDGDAFAINTDSLVVMVDVGGVRFVATGDATGATMAQCNAALANAQVRADYFTNVFAVTMPHHGAENTTLGIEKTGTLEGRRDDAAAFANFRQFIAYIPPQTLLVSADLNTSYKHPSAFLMKEYYPTLATTRWYTDPALTNNAHYYTAYFTKSDGYQVTNADGTVSHWPTTTTYNWWYSLQTDVNVFTTYYFNPTLQYKSDKALRLPPNPGTLVDPATAKLPIGVAWIYGIAPDGTKTFARLENRAASLAERRQIFADARAMWLEEPPDPRAAADRVGRADVEAARLAAVDLAPRPIAARAPGFARLRRVR